MKVVGHKVLQQCAEATGRVTELAELDRMKAQVQADHLKATITVGGRVFTVCRDPKREGYGYYTVSGDALGLDAEHLKRFCHKVIHSFKASHRKEKKQAEKFKQKVKKEAKKRAEKEVKKGAKKHIGFEYVGCCWGDPRDGDQ